MWGKSKKTKIMRGKVTEKKKIVQRRSEEKKFLQSELHSRVYKLYSPEGHLGSQFIPQF